MNRHPGGVENSRCLLSLANLSPAARVLDMGAGDGETVALLRSLGFDAVGIDLEPRGEGVLPGDFIHSPFPAGSFDAVISQCAFHVSGDTLAALTEAARLLCPGGKLLLADVHFRETDLGELAQKAGFRVLHREDMTPKWKEYYIDAIWRGTAVCLPAGRKYSYTLLICEREG